MIAPVTYLRSYDDRRRVDDETARRVRDATVKLLRDVPFSSLTTRSIAKRANVSHSEVLAHFRSKDAIVAEIYLDRLRAAPLTVDADESARARIAAQFAHLVMLLADEPGLAAACSSALIGALVHASCGADTFRQTAEDLASVVAVVLPDR